MSWIQNLKLILFQGICCWMPTIRTWIRSKCPRRNLLLIQNVLTPKYGGIFWEQTKGKEYIHGREPIELKQYIYIYITHTYIYVCVLWRACVCVCVHSYLHFIIIMIIWEAFMFRKRNGEGMSEAKQGEMKGVEINMYFRGPCCGFVRTNL